MVVASFAAAGNMGMDAFDTHKCKIMIHLRVKMWLTHTKYSYTLMYDTQTHTTLGNFYTYFFKKFMFLLILFLIVFLLVITPTASEYAPNSHGTVLIFGLQPFITPSMHQGLHSRGNFPS